MRSFSPARRLFSCALVAMGDEFLEDFVEQIKSSRENALAGKYDDALVFYDGCVARSLSSFMLGRFVF